MSGYGYVRVVRNKEGGGGEGREGSTLHLYRTSLYGHVFGAETTEVAFIRVVTCMASCSPMRPIRNGRALAVLSLLLAHGAHADSKAMSGFGSASLKLSDSAILEKLKQLYAEKLRPLEKKSMYHDLREPGLSDAWFDARPTVLLLGQYSVGKTSFIRYLLGRDFPQQHIGPEPTTDRFIAVMYGEREKVTPGNALTSQPDTPYYSLRHYGTNYLDKLRAVSLPAPILRRITLVDSPGVQAGEKQKGGRGYDFLEVIKWWAQHSDRVLILFDPNKLDISDEFRSVIEELKVHAGKVRVVLNKADEVEPQKLMRVYGALMWSLGSIVASPEVPRVYIGSFWDAPFREGGMSALMEAEEADLVHELATLPEDNVMNKINEIARRARLVQVHVHLLAYMREQVLSKWMGRKQAQEWVCSPEGMRHCYEATQRQHSLSRGDFPDWHRLSEQLKRADFNTFFKPTSSSKELRALSELMETDVPNLIQQLHAVQKRATPERLAAFQPHRQHRPPPPLGLNAPMMAQVGSQLPSAQQLRASAQPQQSSGLQSQREALSSVTARLREAATRLQQSPAGIGSAAAPPFMEAASQPQPVTEVAAPDPMERPMPEMAADGAEMGLASPYNAPQAQAAEYPQHQQYEHHVQQPHAMQSAEPPDAADVPYTQDDAPASVTTFAPSSNDQASGGFGADAATAGADAEAPPQQQQPTNETPPAEASPSGWFASPPSGAGEDASGHGGSDFRSMD